LWSLLQDPIGGSNNNIEHDVLGTQLVLDVSVDSFRPDDFTMNPPVSFGRNTAAHIQGNEQIRQAGLHQGLAAGFFDHGDERVALDPPRKAVFDTELAETEIGGRRADFEATSL
jgi:hypothetical protein